jgi:hypothetical protein
LHVEILIQAVDKGKKYLNIEKWFSELRGVNAYGEKSED